MTTWTRARRRLHRGRCRPSLEALESKLLLSLAPDPVPHPISSSAEIAITSGPHEALLGAARTRARYDIDGEGLAIAVIDTGVNYRHSALGGSFGTPQSKVVGGFDFGEGDADPNADSWSHGTAVAGVAAADGTGIAPGADVVALRVFNDANRGGFDKIADALQWVIDHHEELRISVVNLSLSDGGNHTVDRFSNDGHIGEHVAGLIAELKELNIPVVSATGNSFQGQAGMGFTAILPETISVTASDGADHLLPDAQRLGGPSGTDLAAPGANLPAPLDGDGLTPVSGTSFAAPLVSGAVLLLQDLYQERFGHLPSVDDVAGWLKDGADPIVDPATGISLGRLNIASSAALVPGQPATPPEIASIPVDVPPAPEPAPAPEPTPAPPVPQPEVIINGVLVSEPGNPLPGVLGQTTLTRAQIWTGDAVSDPRAEAFPAHSLNHPPHEGSGRLNRWSQFLGRARQRTLVRLGRTALAKALRGD